MANPAAEFRAAAQSKWPGATVVARGRKSIVHEHPSIPGKKMLDVSIGPVHFGPGEDQEIDTAWTTGAPVPWQHQMLLADYNAYLGNNAGSIFNSGQIMRYVHPTTGAEMAFQPQQLQWTNDLGQIEDIATPANVPVLIDGDTANWVAAFGVGLDFQVQTQTARLQKLLTINSLGQLLSPPQSIINGGNPVLRLQFIFQKSGDVDIYIGGALWDEKSNNPQVSSEIVEFRSGATPLWHFLPATAWDSSEGANEEITPTYRFRKQGSNLFVEVLTPWSWLQTATYPVFIDPTIDAQVGASTDDGYWRDDGGFDNTGTIMYLGDRDSPAWGALSMYGRFTGLSGADGHTIDVAYFGVNPTGTGTVNVVSDVYAIDADNAAAPTSAADANGKTLTTASASWTIGSYTRDVFNNSSSLVSVFQELSDSGYLASGVAVVMAIANLGSTTSNDRIQLDSYDGDTSLAPKLHIEYTVGGGGSPGAIMTPNRGIW